LATALCELATHLVFQRSVVDPLVASGAVVIDEAPSFKGIAKELVLHESLAPDGARGEARRRLLELAIDLIGATSAGSVGVLVSGDPALAERWRLRQRGRPGAMEHFGIAATGDESSFVEFEARVQTVFAGAARRWGWIEVVMRDRPQDQNIAAALLAITNELRRRGLVAAEGPERTAI